MKKFAIIAMVALLSACSGMKDIEERKTYAEPGWYQDCAQSGTEGWFWNTKEYAYACGAGDSAYGQAAEEQMYAIALNNFAKRINGTVNSETVINITDNDLITKYLFHMRGGRKLFMKSLAGLLGYQKT